MDRLETAHAAKTSGGCVSGRDKINKRLGFARGAKTTILSVNIGFTATLHLNLRTPNFTGIRAPSVRVGGARLSHNWRPPRRSKREKTEIGSESSEVTVGTYDTRVRGVRYGCMI